MPSSLNEALVRRAVEAIWNRGDLDVADELFGAAYVNHYGLIADLVLGPEAVKISAAFHRLAVPGLCVVIEELSSDADSVVVRWAASGGRVAGTAGSSSAESYQKSLKGTTRSRLASGRIVESWTEWDQIGVLRDLGMVPDD